MAIVFLLWHSIFKFCFHYFILFRFIKFWHISVEFVDSFLCVFVTMLASQMKWFTVAYSAKSTKSYICNFNFHPFVMVVNSTIFPLSFSPMNGMKQMNGYNFTDARLLNNALHLLNLPFLSNVKLINWIEKTP